VFSFGYRRCCSWPISPLLFRGLCTHFDFFSLVFLLFLLFPPPLHFYPCAWQFPKIRRFVPTLFNLLGLIFFFLLTIWRRWSLKTRFVAQVGASLLDLIPFLFLESPPISPRGFSKGGSRFMFSRLTMVPLSWIQPPKALDFAYLLLVAMNSFFPSFFSNLFGFGEGSLRHVHLFGFNLTYVFGPYSLPLRALVSLLMFCSVSFDSDSYRTGFGMGFVNYLLPVGPRFPNAHKGEQTLGSWPAPSARIPFLIHLSCVLVSWSYFRSF